MENKTDNQRPEWLKTCGECVCNVEHVCHFHPAQMFTDCVGHVNDIDWCFFGQWVVHQAAVEQDVKVQPAPLDWLGALPDLDVNHTHGEDQCNCIQGCEHCEGQDNDD